eukprot:6160996-Prorocentrum_lima.AAC.1
MARSMCPFRSGALAGTGRVGASRSSPSRWNASLTCPRSGSKVSWSGGPAQANKNAPATTRFSSSENS